MDYIIRSLNNIRNSWFESVLANVDFCASEKLEDCFERSLEIKESFDHLLHQVQTFDKSYCSEVIDDV